MSHPEQQLPRASQLSQDDEFEEVRRSFVARLRGEQASLGALAKALRRAREDPRAAFGNLEVFAHRLRGAAAVFDDQKLSEAAKVLELAVGVALLERGLSSEPLVWAALRTLTAQLDSRNGQEI